LIIYMEHLFMNKKVLGVLNLMQLQTFSALAFYFTKGLKKI